MFKVIYLKYSIFPFFLILLQPQNVIAGTVSIQCSGNVVDDARITSGSRNYNGGSDTWGNVTYWSSNGCTERTYIRIPIPDIIAPDMVGSITHANLKLYFSGLDSGPFDISVHEVTEDWDEFAITWNNKPEHSRSALDTVTLIQEKVWVTFSVTSLVKEWIIEEKPNYGSVLKPLNEYSGTHSLAVLESSDNPNASLRPILEIISPEFPDILVIDFVSSTDNIENKLLTDFQLNQNYPNPFNTSTIISYSIPKSGVVTLKIYDVLGRENQSLVSERQEANTYSIHFDANELPSGIYFYTLQVGSDFIETKKMLYLR